VADVALGVGVGLGADGPPLVGAGLAGWGLVGGVLVPELVSPPEDPQAHSTDNSSSAVANVCRRRTAEPARSNRTQASTLTTP
jgi:hypothetical protein